MEEDSWMGMCTSQVYLISPGLESRRFRRTWQQKNGMGTINTNIFDIDGAHGMFLLPRNTKTALNRISSEPGLLKIPCGPWHLGRAWAGPSSGQGCSPPPPFPAPPPAALAQ